MRLPRCLHWFNAFTTAKELCHSNFVLILHASRTQDWIKTKANSQKILKFSKEMSKDKHAARRNRITAVIMSSEFIIKQQNFHFQWSHISALTTNAEKTKLKSKSQDKLPIMSEKKFVLRSSEERQAEKAIPLRKLNIGDIFTGAAVQKINFSA